MWCVGLANCWLDLQGLFGMLAGDLWTKMWQWDNVLGTTTVPIFVIKKCLGFVLPHSY